MLEKLNIIDYYCRTIGCEASVVRAIACIRAPRTNVECGRRGTRTQQDMRVGAVSCLSVAAAQVKRAMSRSIITARVAVAAREQGNNIAVTKRMRKPRICTVKSGHGAVVSAATKAGAMFTERQLY